MRAMFGKLMARFKAGGVGSQRGCSLLRPAAAAAPLRGSYGRLYRSLLLAVLLLAGGALGLCPPLVPFSHAQDQSGPTYAQAMVSCQQFLASTGNDPRYGTCQDFTTPSGVHVVCPVVPTYGHCYTSNGLFPDNEISWTMWSFTGSGPNHQCDVGSSSDHFHTYIWGASVPLGKQCYQGCTVNINVNRSNLNDVPVKQGDGTWRFPVSYDNTGDGECSDGLEPATAGTAAPPPICKGKICFNQQTNQFNDGNNAFAPGPKGPSDGDAAPHPPEAGCFQSYTNPSQVICAGETAPTPPKPPIDDPVSQHTDSQQFQYGQVDPQTGQVTSTITVNVGTYTGTDGQTYIGDPNKGGKIGGGTADDGDGNCTAGKLCDDQYVKSNCGADPAVGGDPLLGAIAVQLHQMHCEQQAAVDADAMRSLKGTDPPDHAASEIFKEEDDDTPGLLSGLDASGFLGGRGACPRMNWTGSDGKEHGLPDALCTTFDMLATYIVGTAYFLAAMILLRVNRG